MKIAIIGAGFTGLTAAYELLKKQHQVTIFEKAPFLGGLAGGIKNALEKPDLEWEWDLEQFYHHWFINDDHVFELGNELGLEHKFITTRPVSSVLYQEKIYPFDSPLSILRFPHLSISEKFKTAITMAQLKYFYREKNSQVLEKVTAHECLQKKLGYSAYQKLWEPLLKGKFGKYYQDVNMCWFWARVYKRTSKLVYYQGGFSTFVQDLAHEIYRRGGKIRLNAQIENINIKHPDQITLKAFPPIDTDETYQRVIVTTPPPTLSKLLPDLPTDYTQKLDRNRGIGALAVILSLKHPLMDKVYWLNVNDLEWPFLAVVEHTNFMSKEKYNNEHLVYIGDYLDKDHPHMRMSKQELIEKFTPYLKKINPLFSEESINRSFLFKASYAQPVPEVNYSSTILPLTTPAQNIYLATMAQIHPWDRGTNYAIELGKRVAGVI